ncbi:hypothetical protein PMIN04_001521 [Paraphaeosphaeria minitans]
MMMLVLVMVMDAEGGQPVASMISDLAQGTEAQANGHPWVRTSFNNGDHIYRITHTPRTDDGPIHREFNKASAQDKA